LRGDVLRVRVDCEAYAAAYYDPYSAEEFFHPPLQAPYVKLAAVANEAGGLTLFALNRDVEQEMTVSVSARGFGRLAVTEATVLTDGDLKAANTKAAPFRVKPTRLSGVAVGAETVRMELPPASWTVVNLMVAS
jgi:alpha-L-arabinofuranosidase